MGASPLDGLSQRAFRDELPGMLHERGLSQRALAQRANISPAHLGKILRGAQYKTASGSLAGKVAVALGLPPDYWPEYREALVVQSIKADAQLRDDLYQRLMTEDGWPEPSNDRTPALDLHER